MEEAIQLLKDIRDLLQRAENRATYPIFPMTPAPQPWQPRAPWDSGPWSVDGTGNPPPRPGVTICANGAAP